MNEMKNNKSVQQQDLLLNYLLESEEMNPLLNTVKVECCKMGFFKECLVFIL